MFATGLQRGRPDGPMGIAKVVHLASLPVTFLALMYMGRHLWFFFDEWDVLGNPALSLLAPHNEHWSTIPYLVYDALYPLFGLRTYAPYLGVTLLLHVGVAHLLWRILVAADVRPWLATALAGVFLFLGAGAENLVWAFQMGFVGSLFLGLLQVRLVDHDGRLDRRDVAAWLAATAALMCSDVGVVMVMMAGVVALFRRGPRALIAAVVPPALVFLAWYAAVGHGGQFHHGPPGPLSMIQFVYSGLAATLGQATGLDRVHLGGLMLLGLSAWTVYAAPRLYRRAPVAVAGLVAAVTFFGIVGVGRVDLGAGYSQASRYLYVATALLLPGVGVALTSVARRARPLEPVLVGLLAVSMVSGGLSLRGHYHDQTVLDASGERHILAAADLLRSGAPTVGRIPDPHVAPQLDIARLDMYRRQGALPDEVGAAVPSPLEREQVQVQLQLALSSRPLFSVGNGVAASAYEADVVVTAEGCWQVTSRGISPELRVRTELPASIQLRVANGATLGLGGAPSGSPVQVVVAPLQLPAATNAYLNSVLAPGSITLGLPLDGTIIACGVRGSRATLP